MEDINDNFNLKRFVKAQEHTYLTALYEIRDGYKMSHWMWFIFPQHKKLGHSEIAQHYGISGLEEAKNYLAHPILGKRLREITGELLQHKDKTPEEILGHVDTMKLKSCMTLFNLVAPNDVFKEVLNAFYQGKSDKLTISLLQPTEHVSHLRNQQHARE